MTIRANAVDLSNLVSFLAAQGLGLEEVRPTGPFHHLGLQRRRPKPAAKVASIRGTATAPATTKLRIASVRGLFEGMVVEGTREGNPCRRPAGRVARDHSHDVCSDTSIAVKGLLVLVVRQRTR